MTQASDQGTEYQEKPFQGLRKLSAIYTVLGYLSFLGGLVLGFVLFEEYYSDLLFFLGIAGGFITGTGYLIIAGLIKLLISMKEDMEEMVNNTRLIAAQFKTANQNE